MSQVPRRTESPLEKISLLPGGQDQPWSGLNDVELGTHERVERKKAFLTTFCPVFYFLTFKAQCKIKVQSHLGAGDVCSSGVERLPGMDRIDVQY